MAYFPLYIDISSKECLVIGGGSVAYRKALLLLEFDAKVNLVSPNISTDILNLSKENSGLTIYKREYSETDLEKMELVIVATDDIEFNESVSYECRKRNILVNVVDDKEKCTFIVPSIVREKNVVAAFSSSGNSPLLTKYLKDKEKEILTPFIGELNEFMGQIRDEVKNNYISENERKIAYNNVLKYALKYGDIPSKEKVEELIHDI